MILNAAIVQQAAGQLQNNDNHSYSSIVHKAGGLIQPNQNPIVQQAVGQLHPTSILCKILWGHHLTILGKSATIQEGLYYLKQTLSQCKCSPKPPLRVFPLIIAKYLLLETLHRCLSINSAAEKFFAMVVSINLMAFQYHLFSSRYYFSYGKFLATFFIILSINSFAELKVPSVISLKNLQSNVPSTPL